MKIESKKGWLSWPPDSYSWEKMLFTAQNKAIGQERSILLRASDWKRIKRVLDDIHETDLNGLNSSTEMWESFHELQLHLAKRSAKK